MFFTPDSTSEAMTGSSGGRPAFSACLASHLASSACVASLPGYSEAALVRSTDTPATPASGAAGALTFTAGVAATGAGATGGGLGAADAAEATAAAPRLAC